MAALALRTELPVMHVVCLVTAAAAGRRGSDAFLRWSVTTTAGEPRVATVQGESRQVAVVETGDRPGVTGMASAAVGPQGASVNIVITVAVNTFS